MCVLSLRSVSLYSSMTLWHFSRTRLWSSSLSLRSSSVANTCGRGGGGGGGGGFETTLITGSRLNKRVWWHSLGGVRPLVCMDALQECYYPQNYIYRPYGNATSGWSEEALKVVCCESYTSLFLHWQFVYILTTENDAHTHHCSCLLSATILAQRTTVSISIPANG